jgi:probable F420-dependent oxidoreductase
MSVQVGIGTFPGQVPIGEDRPVADAYQDILALARVADQVGFDSFWVSEHHGALNQHLPSPLVVLAAAAAVTRRIRLGTAVVLAPFQHPIRFAEDCAVVDQLARGRLIVGIGSGWREAEFESFGIPMAERASRTTELVQICRAAWDQERFSFHGIHHALDDVVVTPKPFARLRLFLGGSAPGAVARAGRFADGFMGTGTPQIGLERFRELVSRFDRAALQADRRPEDLAVGFHVNAWVSPDGVVPLTVRRAMWEQIGTSLRWHAGASGSTLPPMDEWEIERRAFMGTPAEVVEQLRPWVEAFGDRELHVLFRLHYPGMRLEQAEPAVRLFAAEVIPALRRPVAPERAR